MKFAKKIMVYFFGSILSKMVVFFLLPIYTKYIDPLSYGENDLAYTTVIMLVDFFFLEAWIALLRFSYDNQTVSGRKKIFTNTMVLLGICLPFYLIGSITSSVLLHLPNMIWMILFGLSLLSLDVFQFKIRADGNSLDFLISGAVSAIMQLIVAIVALFALHLGAITIFLSPIVGNGCACLYIIIKNSYYSEFQLSLLDRRYIKELFLFSYPLAINYVAFWGMTNANKYFARFYLGAEVNGYIALATKFTSIVARLVQVFALAWQESAFEHSSSENRSVYYSDVFTNYYLLMALGASGIMLVTNLFFNTFISQSYLPARATLPIYYISSFFNAISNFYGHLFSAEKKTKVLLSSTIFGTIANIGLLLFTVKKLGIYSVPLSLVFGYLVNVGMRMMNYQKINRLNLHVPILFAGFTFVLVSMILCYIDNVLIQAAMIVGICAFALYKYKDILKSAIQMVKAKAANG